VPANQIIISEEFLRGLQKEYTGHVDLIDKIIGKVVAYGTQPDSRFDVTQPIPLRLGGKGFDEAIAVNAKIELIRQGLVDRFKTTRTEIHHLDYGIRFLLADSDAVEQVTTLTSQQFEYFMPKGS
jgi:hypothetical protein